MRRLHRMVSTTLFDFKFRRETRAYRRLLKQGLR